ncbi:hypothetical protein C8R44DRAFT_734692 [Mycena epipterygia]|nr:hypothetical protein C8R44DRAFT_734692 [Mycena epipterygia]
MKLQPSLLRRRHHRLHRCCLLPLHPQAHSVPLTDCMGWQHRRKGHPLAAHSERTSSIGRKAEEFLESYAGNIFRRKFHPAAKSQLDGDLNPHDSKSKKHKQKGKACAHRSGGVQQTRACSKSTSPEAAAYQGILSDFTVCVFSLKSKCNVAQKP